jgi:hypothetical protein
MYVTKTRSGYVIRSHWYRPSWREPTRPMHSRYGKPHVFTNWQAQEYKRWLELRDMAAQGKRLPASMPRSAEIMTTAACYFPQTLPLLIAEAAE